MVNIKPALLALITHFFGFRLYPIPIHSRASPYISSTIFTIALYFIILQYDLYPKRLRRLPWPLIILYEFFSCMCLLEFVLSILWFPLERNIFLAISRLNDIVHRSVSPKSSLSVITSISAAFLQPHRAGILFSYVLSLSTLLIALHGTYVIDLNILRAEGLGCFWEDLVTNFYISSKDLRRSILRETTNEYKGSCKESRRKHIWKNKDSNRGLKYKS